MEAKELQIQLDEFGKKLDQCHVKLHNGNDKNAVIIRWLIGIFLTLLITAGSVIFYMGSLDRTVELLERNMIEKAEWERNDKMTWDSYNKIWFNKDTRFQIRGAPGPKL